MCTSKWQYRSVHNHLRQWLAAGSQHRDHTISSGAIVYSPLGVVVSPPSEYLWNTPKITDHSSAPQANV